jgi:hypothetical protein
MYKTENRLFKDIFEIINISLTNLGIMNWAVLQNYLAMKYKVQDKSIFFNKIYSGRVGWQGRKYKNIVEGDIEKLIKVENWTEEILFQIGAYRKRQENDGIETITSKDILKKLLYYFQSIEGLKVFKEKGYEILRINEVRDNPVLDDSGNYNYEPSFDITIFTNQEVENEVEKVEEVIIETKFL